MATMAQAERTLRAISLVSDEQERHAAARDDLIMRAVAEGWSYRQIGEAARITAARVCQIVKARQQEATR